MVLGNYFFGSDAQSTANKIEDKQEGFQQTKRLLHSKRNEEKNERRNIMTWKKIFASHLSNGN